MNPVLKYSLIVFASVIIGAIIMDRLNYGFAKQHGYIKRGGIFENII